MRTVTRVFRCLTNEEGANLVETALASTVFLAMLIGVLQMMLAVSTYNYVSDAAREGTRYAIVRGSACSTNTPNLSNCNATTGQIQTYVRGIKYPGLTASKLVVTTTWLSASVSYATGSYSTSWSTCASGTCNAPGNIVKVVAKYPFSLSVPFVPKATLNLTSTSQMVISQ